MTLDPNHIPRAPEVRRKKSKWEALNELDARATRRRAELRAASEAQEATHAHHADNANLLWGPPPGIIVADGMPTRAPDVDVVTSTTAPEPAPLSAWWGVALAALAAVCAIAFAVVAQ